MSSCRTPAATFASIVGINSRSRPALVVAVKASSAALSDLSSVKFVPPSFLVSVAYLPTGCQLISSLSSFFVLFLSFVCSLSVVCTTTADPTPSPPVPSAREARRRHFGAAGPSSIPESLVVAGFLLFIRLLILPLIRSQQHVYPRPIAYPKPQFSYLVPHVKVKGKVHHTPRTKVAPRGCGACRNTSTGGERVGGSCAIIRPVDFRMPVA